MTFEALMISFAGGLFLIVCGLVVFIFLSLKREVESLKNQVQKEVGSFREMLDLKLTQLGHALEIINKDLREIISDTDKTLRGEIMVLDRRMTHVEAENHNRRNEDKYK